MCKPLRCRVFKASLWTVFGLFLAVVISVPVILSPSVLTSLVGRLASEYVDGDVSFSKVMASAFKSFPNLNVTIDDLSITYPHERFAAYDSLVPPDNPLLNLGKGVSDTLAHFEHFSIAVNWIDALMGKINVRHAILRHPRIFLHRFDSTAANWQMFRLPSDNTASGIDIPPVSVGRISLDKAPFAVYTSLPDTLATALSLRHLNLNRHRDHYKLDIASDVILSMNSVGRMSVPVFIKSEFHPDPKKKIYEVKNLKASLAMIEMTGSGKVDLSGDDIYVKAAAVIDQEPVSEVAEYFGENFPILKKFRTDARLSADAHCDGFYVKETGSLPEMSLHLIVPDARVEWEGLDEKGRFDLELTASTRDGKLNAEVPDLCLDIQGVGVRLNGSAEDLLCGDPLFRLNGDVHASLDSLARFLPESMDIRAHGSLNGIVKGDFRLTQFDIYNFGQLGLSGELHSDGIRIEDFSDSLFAFLGRTSIILGQYSHSEDSKDAHDEDVHRHFGVSGSIDSLYAEYGVSTFIRGSGLRISAHNDDDVIPGNPGKHSLHAHLDIASISMMDLDSCYVAADGSVNVLKLTMRPEGSRMVPYLSLTSRNKSIAVRESVNRLTAEGASISVSAHPDRLEARDRLKKRLDSLQRAYPGVLRDSLTRVSEIRRRGGVVPDYMTEKDFVRRDIQIRLGESVAVYLRNYDISGSLDVKSGTVITPYYPVDNRFSDVRGRFTNNSVNLSNITINSGSSDISASGVLTGFRRMLTSGTGRMNLEMNVTSDLIDVNEMLLAAGAGQKFVHSGENLALSGLDDITYLDEVRNKAEMDSASTSHMIVLPSNLNAKIDVQANKVRYSNLETSFVSSTLEMKERCLQVTNTLAMTNMGELFLEGFYATRTKKDMKAGFDMMLSNITAEKVIRLFPAVDSIMPMLKAFKGLLDCEMAATASIDTAMNVLLPTLSGIVRIDGRNLSLAESADLDKLRRTLMFKDRDSSYIDAMSVRGIIKDDQLEVFPFILKIDRYTLALNGVQKFDQSFRYHVSALKSFVPFRFGVNLKGNFDDWKWRLGKARFKSLKIPDFEEQVDGVRINLVNAIHNIFERGVEQAIRQNQEAQQAVEARKEEVEYSVIETEELSDLEKRALIMLGRTPD